MSVEVTDSVILWSSTGVDNIIHHCQRKQRHQKQLVLINCRLSHRQNAVCDTNENISYTQTHIPPPACVFPDCCAVTQMDNMYFSANVSHSTPKTHLLFIYESNKWTQYLEHLFQILFQHRWITEQYKQEEKIFFYVLPQIHLISYKMRFSLPYCSGCQTFCPPINLSQT